MALGSHEFGGIGHVFAWVSSRARGSGARYAIRNTIVRAQAFREQYETVARPHCHLCFPVASLFASRVRFKEPAHHAQEISFSLVQKHQHSERRSASRSGRGPKARGAWMEIWCREIGREIGPWDRLGVPQG